MTTRLATLTQKQRLKLAALMTRMTQHTWTAFRQCLLARRKQQKLVQFSDAQLADIGLTRSRMRANTSHGWFWE